MELDPQNHNGDGLLGPSSIIVVYVDPLGIYIYIHMYIYKRICIWCKTLHPKTLSYLLHPILSIVLNNTALARLMWAGEGVKRFLPAL